jgi:hypothetical protein
MHYYNVTFTQSFFVAAEDIAGAEQNAYGLAAEMFGDQATDMPYWAEEMSAQEAKACGFDA